jgi:DNA mismatch repair protein MutS2
VVQQKILTKRSPDCEAQRRRQETNAREAQSYCSKQSVFITSVQKANSLQERERALRASQEQAVQSAIASAKGEIAG